MLRDTKWLKCVTVLIKQSHASVPLSLSNKTKGSDADPDGGWEDFAQG